jgi:hypothetical protein
MTIPAVGAVSPYVKEQRDMNMLIFTFWNFRTGLQNDSDCTSIAAHTAICGLYIPCPSYRHLRTGTALTSNKLIDKHIFFIFMNIDI